MGMVDNAVLIRRYETEDHGFVCELFRESLMENWIPAYRWVVTGSAPLASPTQAAILIAAFALSPSFLAFLAVELITQSALLAAIYYIYWAYYREHMESDMRDKELVFYTGHGEKKGGFFVAEVDGQPVGTVAYQEKDGSTIEVCRLAVISSMRRRKIGQLLVQKICQVGLQLGFERATLETDSGTLVAINFYKNTGWTEECRYPWYPFRWIHGTELIRYYKQL